jgi:hypothetical protein
MQAGEAPLLKFPRATQVLDASSTCFSTDAQQFCADRQIKPPQCQQSGFLA